MSNQRALEFIELCKAAKDAAEVEAALYAECDALGYAYVACSSHVDPINPPKRAVSMCNYPLVWKTRFSEQGYPLIDPVFLAAVGTALPFTWQELLERGRLSAKQRLIFDEARECGVTGGMTLPLHSPNALAASCSLVPGPDGVDPAALPSVLMMALYAHETALAFTLGGETRAAPILSPRQRECLALVSAGKSDSVTGDILGISGRTVHNLIERAKARYGVSSRIQLAIKALRDGQIRVDDVDA